MTIDIIIPNYNGADLIEKNLPFVLAAHKKYEGKIIIVDDGSKDLDRQKLKEIVKKHSDRVALVEHKKNRGFSSAVNTGVLKSDANYVVLLNSDVKPSENFLKSAVEKLLKDKMLFAVGCVDESVEGNDIVKRGRGIGYWEKGMLLHKKGEIDKEDTFWVSGGSCILRREIYRELGGMDTLYNPFYWEDIDLSYRARKAGYKITFDKDSVVRHYHEEGAIKKSYTKEKVTRTAYRNQFIFIWKNITSRHLLINHFLFLPANIIGALKRLDFAFIEGLFLASLKLPDIMKKRNLQKPSYKAADVTLLDHIT